jgi:hypothetical protein
MQRFRFATRAVIASALILAANSGASGQTSVAITLDETSQSDFTYHPLGTVNSDRRAGWAAGAAASGDPNSRHDPTHGPQIALPGYYPADLVNPNNGITIQTAQHHGFYINTTPAGVGSPANFLDDLGKSDFIGITDQYVGTSANNRYTVGQELSGTGSLPHVLSVGNIVSLVHTAAKTIGLTGYSHIYHLYLAPGQDVCLGTGVCYSPDSPPNWVFCAFHGSVTFRDIGHVLLTVIPYQNVPGCSVAQPSPNGAVVDSTAAVLSHEVFETITDPDSDAWFNQTSLDLFGAEIGDECQNASFNYGAVPINGKYYEVQPEYANNLHGCSFSPSPSQHLK